MYLSHYNLAEKPFQISTDPKFLWMGEKHREALAVLKYGIMNNQGFVLLTGDVGTGKTTLINALINSLDRDTIVAVVSDPKLEKLEFFKLIARSFKFKKSFNDKLDFTIYFSHFLNAAHKENKKVLLIVDEAQNISLELLEEIRLLSNIEIPEKKLLNIFFVGQNEFNNILMKTECRPLRQRITVTYNIDPLTEKETGEYIAHRLKVAGARPEIFNKKTIRKIYSFSKGYPRLINILSDQALLTGYVQDLKEISPKVIRECIKELRLPGENKSDRTYKVNPRSKEKKKLRRRAALYTCLFVLLIPLLYPPVSTTIKTYLTSVVNFYDHLFQQFSLPAQGRNPKEFEALEPESNTGEYAVPGEQQSHTESPTVITQAANGVQPADSNSEIDRGAGEETINLKDFKLLIPFDYNSNEVPESAYTDLDRAVAVARNNPDVTIVIKGYTDTRGSASYNRQLSAFRANMVKSYLIGQGVKSERIEAIGMGEENRIESNMTEAGRRANRRVEVEIRGRRSEDR